jgi:hypothetical protein
VRYGVNTCVEKLNMRARGERSNMSGSSRPVVDVMPRASRSAVKPVGIGMRWVMSRQYVLSQAEGCS